jgi:porin
MRAQTKTAVVMAVALATCPGVARADDAAPFSDTLTGDWGGYRSWLRDLGIDFQLGYTSETASNVQGGTKEGTRYTDQWAIGSTLDLQKLLGFNDAKFQVTITDRNGRNLSGDEHLGTLQQVQEVYGRGQTWRITQFWYDQKYFGGLLDWKIGRLTEGEDFASFSCDFMNLTFCGAPPGNIAGDYWFNWPVSQWATRLKASLPGLGYVQLGAYEINPSYLTRRYAFNLDDPPAATGMLLPLEVAWLPTFGAGQLKGSYKFGAWYNTSRSSDVFENTQGQALALAGGQPRGRDGQYGFYVNFLQQVTQRSAAEPERGLRIFFNATFADRQTESIDNQIALGVFYTGIFESRPHDDIGLGLGRTHVNSRVTNAEKLQNAAGFGPVGVQTSEYAGELYYGLQATRWLTLRPNLQYIHQPGGLEHATDDVILGLKSLLKF